MTDFKQCSINSPNSDKFTRLKISKQKVGAEGWCDLATWNLTFNYITVCKQRAQDLCRVSIEFVAKAFFYQFWQESRPLSIKHLTPSYTWGPSLRQNNISQVRFFVSLFRVTNSTLQASFSHSNETYYITLSWFQKALKLY